MSDSDYYCKKEKIKCVMADIFGECRLIVCSYRMGRIENACEGCKHVGTHDIDYPCNVCVRREKDYYESE